MMPLDWRMALWFIVGSIVLRTIDYILGTHTPELNASIAIMVALLCLARHVDQKK